MKHRRLRRWLRICLWGTTALLVGLAGLYLYVTRPSRLRAAALRALGHIEGTDAKIGTVSFSPWDGLELVDLELTLNEKSPLYARILAPRQHPPLRVAHVRIHCDLWQFLSGTFRPTDVQLQGAVVTVLHDPQTGETNWDLPAGGGRSSPDTAASLYPRITIDQGDIQLLTLDAGRPRLLQRWIVDAAGALDESGAEPAYVLRMYRTAALGAAPLAARDRERLVAALHLGPHWLAAQLDWLDLDVAMRLARQTSALPPAMMDALDSAHARGRLRLKRLSLRDNAVEGVELDLTDLHFSMPVEDETACIPPAERFVQITEAAGTLALSQGELTLDLKGRVNGAAAKMSFRAKRPPNAPDTAFPSPARDREPVTAANSAPRLESLQNFSTWSQSAALRIENIAFPRVAENAAFLQSQRLPGSVRAFFKDYQPRGPLNFELRLRREPPRVHSAEPSSPPPENEVEFEGTVEVLGVSCRYYRFPYDVEDVHGQFRFSNTGIFLEGLNGRHGAGRIRADGRLNNSHPWTALDLQIRGEALGLDADLYAALPPEYQRLWQDAAPLGVCDVQTRLIREEGSEENGARPVDIQVDAQLLAGSLLTGDGRRLQHADGRLSIHENLLTIHDLHGYLPDVVEADAPVSGATPPALRLNGTLKTAPDAAASTADLHIEGREIPLQQTMQLAGETGPTAAIEFRGLGDVWGRVRGGNGFAGDDAHYVVHVKDGVLRSFDAPVPWNGTRGWIITRPDQRQIRSFSVRQNGAWLDIAGALPAEWRKNEPIRLEIRGGDAAMDRLVRQMVPGRWARLAETLGLAGAGRVDVQLQPRDAAPQDQALDIRLESQRMKPAFLPLDLEEVRGDLALNADGFALRNMQARYGPEGEIRIDGRGAWQTDGERAQFRVVADRLDFCPNLVEAMPGKLAELLKRMAPKGRVRADLDQVRMLDADGRAWEVRGKMRFEKAELQLGFLLTAFDGEINGTCLVSADGGVEIQADFLIERGFLDGRAIENWRGKLTRATHDPWVRLEEVHGRTCAGEAWGSARINPDNSLYELALTFRDLGLEQFLKHGEHDNEALRRGRLDGNIALRGKAGADHTRLGGGELRIRGASLLRTPVLASVAAEANRKAKKAMNDAVDLVELRFVWEGSELKLTRVDLQSRDLRLVGEGRWNLRDDGVELTLVGANPRDWPRVAGLTEFFEAAGQEIMQYRVTGTTNKPQVAAEPLHNLTEPLRQLLKQK